ncbi:copia protein [Tanacetum coccineum]
MFSSNNSTNSNQQTLAESGANERPLMLEKGNYIPWESRFRRFLDNKLEDGERMWNSIQNGFYQRPMIVDPTNPTVPIRKPLSKMTEVDACKNAKEMWERTKRLMHGSEITTHVRYSRLMDEFDKFAAKEGESLDSLHERLTTLMNIMDRNNVRPIPVAINTKFFNCLQPEWSKYVTMIRQNQTEVAISYDELYDLLVPFEPHDGRVDIQTKNASYGGNANKTAGRNRTQGFNTENACDESNQIIQRVPRTESTPGKANVQCYNCNELGHYAHECQKPKVHDAKYFREQMLLTMKDEVGSNLSNEENDFMLDTSHGEDLEELTTAVMLMARFQPANDNAENVPSYDAKAVSQVHASSKVYEQVSHGKRKTIIQTTDDDQIDSNIIFDHPFVENNGGMSKHDSTAHDKYHLLQRELETFKDRVKTFESNTIPYSTYKETCDELERELRNDKDTIDRLVKEKEKMQNDFLKVENEKIIIQHETQLEKKALKEREDRYPDDILDLEEKLSSHDRIVYKMGQSIQTIHMLGKKPNKVYDPFLKAGLGYTNPVRLKKAIAAQPKMYDGDLIDSNKLVIHSTDSEETLEDAEERRNKMRHKMVQIDYEKLNALYETFVPQQELFAE